MADHGKVVKILLFVCNLVVFIAGAICFGLSIYALHAGADITDLVTRAGLPSQVAIFGAAAIVILAFSVLVMIVSGFGCCGAYKENKCLILIYIVLLGFLLISIIAGAVVGYTQNMHIVRNGLIESLKQYVAKDARDAANTDIRVLSRSWDEVQEEFECCGVSSGLDWRLNRHYSNTTQGGNQVPDACCLRIEEQRAEACRTNFGAYNDQIKGCWRKLKDLAKQHQTTLMASSVALIIFMVVNIILALILYCRLD